MSEGPFTNAFVKQMVLATQTQHGIIKYAEAMAQVLAEAGRASCKATGDAPSYAIKRWSKIIEDRALELVRKEPTPTLKRLAKMDRLLTDDPQRTA